MELTQEQRRKISELNKEQTASTSQPTAVPQISQPQPQTPARDLGKSRTWQEQQLEAENPINAMGYIEVPLETLPSGGLFYPEGTKILARPATAGEIRQWTSVDENDPISVSNGLRSIMEKCCYIQIPGQARNWKNIVELDQFSLLFAVRDMTFKNGENQLNVSTTCRSCGTPNKIVVNHNVIKMFEPDSLMMKFYNPEERCFVLRDSQEGFTVKLYLPTLGISQALMAYINNRRQNGLENDEAFIMMAQYLFPTYVGLTDKKIDDMLFESYKWSTRQISAVTELIRRIHGSLAPKVIGSCTSCGSEVTAPVDFPGGFRSIFLVSDILEQLS